MYMCEWNLCLIYVFDSAFSIIMDNFSLEDNDYGDMFITHCSGSNREIIDNGANDDQFDLLGETHWKENYGDGSLLGTHYSDIYLMMIWTLSQVDQFLRWHNLLVEGIDIN